MNAKQAIDQLKPEQWASTSITERLSLLKTVRENLKKLGEALATSDAAMKNALMGEDIFGLSLIHI